MFWLLLLQDSVNTSWNNFKISFIKFLFDLFGYQLNFFTMFDIYKMSRVTH